MKDRKVMKTIGYMVGCLIAAITIGTLLMIAVYLLPVEPMREHAMKAIEMYEDAGDQTQWAPGLVYSLSDNFTDSLMINNAIFVGTDSVVSDAMMNPYTKYDESMTNSLIKELKTGKPKASNIVNYPRYWHGYLIWLKPALFLMNVSSIKTINAFLQFILLIAVILQLVQRLGNKYAIAFVPAICILNPITIGMCFQYSTVYYIMLLSMFILLKWYGPQNLDKCWKLFFWIGIATAYFDFLTYPLVGLGMPLILVILLGSFPLKKSIVEMIKNSVSWGIGYAGMWSGKWLVSYLLTGENTFSDAMEMANYRITGNLENVATSNGWLVEAVNAIRGNLSVLNNAPIWVLIQVIFAVILILLVRKQYKITITQNVIPLLLTACYPFAWYIVLANHSEIHVFMTYRGLVITCFALLCVVAECMVGTDDTKEKNGWIK